MTASFLFANAGVLSKKVLQSTESLDLKSTCGRSYIEKGIEELKLKAYSLQQSVAKGHIDPNGAAQLLDAARLQHVQNAKALGEDSSVFEMMQIPLVR